MHIVRRVLPFEYVKYRAHLKALDHESRLLRFGFFAKDETIDTFCDAVETNTHEHILFCVENSNLEFVGVGHLVIQDQMEMAFSVLQEYRNCGMGSAIMDRIVHYCRTHNLLDGYMVCLSSNMIIKRLCSKYGIKMKNDHGETTGHIRLPAADTQTYVEEAASANVATLDYLIKRSFIPWTISPN
jgi:GNAT superfamily N-acetyltransferase